MSKELANKPVQKLTCFAIVNSELPIKPGKNADRTPKPTNESGQSIRKLDLTLLNNIT